MPAASRNSAATSAVSGQTIAFGSSMTSTSIQDSANNPAKSARYAGSAQS